MNDEDKKAVTQAALDKRADAIRAEEDAKADAARAADARPTISEKAPAPDDDRRRIDKPEPRRELPRQTFSDRSPSYSGQGVVHNIDMQRATNPAAYIKEKREALEKKAPELKRAAENLKQPAPRPETEAGKAWQAEKLRNPETATSWHLGAAAVKNDLNNSPNELVREEHKMRLEVDPVYKNGYENAQRWEAERKAELADDAVSELQEANYFNGADACIKENDGMLNDAEIEEHKSRLKSDPHYMRGYEDTRAEVLLDKYESMNSDSFSFVNQAKDMSCGAADFAKLEHEAAKTGAKLPDAAIEKHKERMVSQPEYRDAYSKAAAPLHAERQAEAAAAREQKQAEAAPAPEAERTQEKELDTGLTLGVGIGIN